MKNLILDARKFSLDLRVEEHRGENEKYDVTAIEMSDMARESADMIDRLTAALMLSEETIRSIAKKAGMSDEDLNSIMDIIDGADSRMVKKYETIRKDEVNE